MTARHHKDARAAVRSSQRISKTEALRTEIRDRLFDFRIDRLTVSRLLKARRDWNTQRADWPEADDRIANNKLATRRYLDTVRATSKALKPAPLPHDHWADPMFRQAMADTDAAIRNFRALDFAFGAIFGKRAA